MEVAQTAQPESGQTETDVSEAIETLGSNTTEDFIWAAAIVVGSIVLANVARQLVSRIVNGSQRGDDFVGDLIGRLVGYLIVAFGVVYGLERLGIAIAPVLGALGVIGIAAAFALQAVLENFVAGVLLQIRRPFSKGDEIETNDYSGVVLSIDSRTMTLRTYDGEVVRLPNSTVMNDPIVNLSTTGRLRHMVEVGVAYGTDLAHAQQVALDAITDVPGVLESPAPEVVASGFGESSLDLECRYWHRDGIAGRIRTRDATVNAINRAFVDEGIEIPFPQRVLHMAPSHEDTGSALPSA